MSLHNNSLLLPNLAVTKGKSASSTDKRIAPNALTLVVTAGLGALLGSSALAATSTATTTQEISGSTQSGGTTLETTITSANGNKVYIDTAEQGAVAVTTRPLKRRVITHTARLRSV